MNTAAGTRGQHASHKKPARTIGALTRTVAARARQAHGARALCGATLAACVVLGCTIQRGGSVEDPDALILATIVGGLAYCAWRMSRSVATGEIARRIDDELVLHGAFVAAYETERERPDSAVAQLGAERVVARVRRRDAMEAAIPHTVGFVALPFLGLAWLMFAIDARDSSAPGASSGALQALSLSATLGQIADRQGAALDDEQMAMLGDSAQLAAAAAAAAAGRDATEQRRDLGDIAETLDSLAGQAPPGSELAEALSRAAAQAEAASLELGEEDTQDDGAAVGGEGAEELNLAPGPDSGPDSGADADGADGGPGGDGTERTEPAAGRGSDGGGSSTTDGPGNAAGAQAAVDGGSAAGGVSEPAAPPPDPSPEVAPAEPDGPTRTVGEVRWWSDRDASIVGRWVERARRHGDGVSPPFGG